MEWILRRFKEPSTWRGLIFLATIAGMNVTPEQTDKIITAAVAVIGLIEVFRKEKPKERPPLPWLTEEQQQLNRKDSL